MNALPASQPSTRPPILAVVNQKGGVGKTTTTVNVAAAFGHRGLRCLVVDLDPQGNASQALDGFRSGGVTAYEVLVEQSPLLDGVRETGEPGVRLLPATVDLAAAEVLLAGVSDRERRLQSALDVIDTSQAGLDVVIVDCPPSLGLLTLNALVAADSLIVPIQPEYYAMDGVNQLTKTVNLVRQHLNPHVDIAAVVVSLFDPNSRRQRFVVDEIASYFGSVMAPVVIARDERLSIAPAEAGSVFRYCKQHSLEGSSSEAAYLRLADHLIARTGMSATRADHPTTVGIDGLEGGER